MNAHLPALLRTARQARGWSVAHLAALGGVSVRLISEFERGKRPHVSLDTAMRLLHLVGVPVTVGDTAEPSRETNDEASRAARAEHRRSTWVGEKTTLGESMPPIAPASSSAALVAVARTSLLAFGLQTAFRSSLPLGSSKRTTP